MSKLHVALVLFLVFGAARAEDEKVLEQPLSAQALEQFNQEDEMIRTALQPGGRYEFLRPDEKSRVEHGLTAIRGLLEQRVAKGTLSEREGVSLVNVEGEVNAILKHCDRNRLICERNPQMGSHIPVTTCRTFGEVERKRAASQKELRDLDVLNRVIKNPNVLKDGG